MAKKPEEEGSRREKETVTVTVVAKQASRMRCGFTFTSEPQTVEVNERQLERIKADPLLAIVQAAVPAPAAS